MAKAKKSWVEKLHTANDLPKIEEAPKQWGGGKMYIPAPIEVNNVMAMIPKGKLITINEIREYLAEEHHTDIACPLTTGIFSWISAHAAEEEKANGKKKITPWWRTLKTGGELNPKFPGEGLLQKELLEDEGHEVILKGKKLKVVNYEKQLVKF